MEQVPHSPEEVIDPRWSRYLHGQQSPQPASGGHFTPHDAGQPRDQERHRAGGDQTITDAELNARIAEVLGPWRTGKAGPREALEALRDLAERVL